MTENLKTFQEDGRDMIEITDTETTRKVYSKEKLLAKKTQVEKYLEEFEK